MQKKNLTTLILSLLVLIAAGVGAELLFARTLSMKGQIVELATEIEGMKGEAEKLSSQQQVANTTGDEIKELDSFFVPADGALDFVEYVESLASASSLVYKIELFDVEQDAVLKEQGKELLRTSIRTTGSIKNIRVFLSLIESLPFNIKVTRVDLRRTVAQAGTTAVKDEWTMLIDFTAIKIMEK